MTKIELEAYDAIMRSRDRWRENSDFWRTVASGDCRWEINDDGQFETECGQMHEFAFGGVIENKHKYCPYCRGRIIT